MSMWHSFLRGRTFIDGQWVRADNNETISVIDPATGLGLGTVPKCGVLCAVGHEA